MDLLFILFIISTAAALAYLLIDFNFKGVYGVMILLWFYYALSVPFDILTGADISYKSARLHMNDISLDFMRPYVIQAFIYYILFIVTFALAYKLSPVKKKAAPTYKKYDLPEIPLWVVFAANVIIGLALLPYTFTLSEVERSLYAWESPTYKLISSLLTLSQALFVIFIVAANDKKKSRYALLFTLIPAIVKGSRFHILLPFLLYAVRFNVKVGRVRLAMIMALALVFIAYWKSIFYGLIIPMYLDSSLDALYYSTLLPELNYSFSALESLDSYMIFANLLERADFSHLFGSSYLITPLKLTLPRFLTGTQLMTLSEQYTFAFDPEHAMEGGGIGFCGIAEAWMNFGIAGPAILGFIWGLLAKYFDHSERGVPFFIFVIVTAMLFRTEMAALYKNWVVIFGVYSLVIFFTLRLFSPGKPLQAGLRNDN